jgi:hypothetical protein
MVTKAILAAAGVVGMGVLAYLYDSFKKKSKRRYIELGKKVKALGSIKEANGRYSISALTKLMSYVNEEGEKEIAKSLQPLVRERRKALKDHDFDEYLELAQEYFDHEKAVEEEFLGYALYKLGIDREEYEEELMNIPPETLQTLMQNKMAAKSGEGVEVPYTLTKQKTKNIFLEVTSIQEGSNEQWKDLFAKLEELKARLDRMMADSLTLAIMTYMVGDILNNEYNITEEQFAKAMEKHNIMQDKEICSLMQQKAAMYQMMMMAGNESG